MMGYWDYTIILTYLSLSFASVGIIVTLNGGGHPYLGIFCLLICGLCDAFDGKVARTKKNRTKHQSQFGVQIDSLSDIVAFGVLPVCIGAAMLRVCTAISDIPGAYMNGNVTLHTITIVCYLVSILYILAALVRLAWFNISEEEERKCTYTGLPVTSAALIFPSVLLVQYFTKTDITIIYFAAMFIMEVLFVAKFKLKKPGLKGIILMIFVGAVEFAILAFGWMCR